VSMSHNLCMEFSFSLDIGAVSLCLLKNEKIIARAFHGQ